jgi:hypothetical protein
MLHILAGNAAEDVQSVLKAAKSGEALPWIVPKKAYVSDRVLFHLYAKMLLPQRRLG